MIKFETFLIRLSRGSGVQGLSAMNSLSNFNNKIKIFRPFLAVSKKRSYFYHKKSFWNLYKRP